MILLAKVVPYGGNAVRYAMEKEKAKLVKVNHMPEGISPTAIWYMMKHHCELHQQDRKTGRKLERFMVTIVASPTKEESKDWTMDNWAKLQAEVLTALDCYGFKPKGEEKEVKSNFHNSMNVGSLHIDSKSGIPHLHIDVCRVDIDGNTNDVHDIHKRAMLAARLINYNHEWQQPVNIRERRREQIAQDCRDVLANMDFFDVNVYFKRLQKRGYTVKPKYDLKGRLVGYTVGSGAVFIKASEIGRGLMASRLKSTWLSYHPKPVETKTATATPSFSTTYRPVKSSPL